VLDTPNLIRLAVTAAKRFPAVENSHICFSLALGIQESHAPILTHWIVTKIDM